MPYIKFDILWETREEMKQRFLRIDGVKGEKSG
jgi:hypothetical protein